MKLWVFLLLLLLALVINGAPRVRKPTLAFEGYIWKQHNIINNGQTQVWRCPKNTCSGRAHSPVGSDDIVVKTPHNHRSSMTGVELALAKEELKKQAVTSNIGTIDLVTNVKSRMGDEASNRLKDLAAAKIVQRQRQLPGRKDVDAPLIEDVIIDMEVSFISLRIPTSFYRVLLQKTKTVDLFCVWIARPNILMIPDFSSLFPMLA